ncbi:MAG: flagellar motor stator protein MotA, partial [Lysobacter sp.]
MVGGKVLALWHLNEIIVIVGSALGSWMVATPIKVIKASIGAIKGVF